jgi:quinate dehydrogenase (quinone)
VGRSGAAGRSTKGALEDTNPFSIRTRLRIPLIGGPLSTASGVPFFAGTQDHFLRASGSETDEDHWSGALPLSSQARPMPCITAECGRQVVIAAAGGFVQGRGDDVAALAPGGN